MAISRAALALVLAGAAPGLLVVRAPQPGRYVLVVTANGHSARAVLIVGNGP